MILFRLYLRFLSCFSKSHIMLLTTHYMFWGDKKMNIVSQATDQEEIDEIKSILQVFIVSARIKHLATTI